MDLQRLDFRLRKGSPLIGRGLNLRQSFGTDILVRARGAVWDIGPYAFRAPPPQREVPPPSVLRILTRAP